MLRKSEIFLWEKGWFIVILLILAVIAIWVWPRFTVPPVALVSSSGQISERYQSLYLLSAIPQTLGGIFTLVFTIYLVVYQVLSKYTMHVPGGAFARATIAYMMLFVVSIIIPLWTIGAPNITKEYESKWTPQFLM